MIEGTFLAVEYMSENKGGRGGTVINVASFGGGWKIFQIWLVVFIEHCIKVATMHF